MTIPSNLDFLENIDPEFWHRISPVMDLTRPIQVSVVSQTSHGVVSFSLVPHEDAFAVDCMEISEREQSL